MSSTEVKFRSQVSDFSKDATSPVRRVRGERVRRKKIQVCEMLGKSRNAMFFNCLCVRMARKVGKAAGAEPFGGKVARTQRAA